MIFEKHLIGTGFSQNLDLPGGMGHGVADRLGLTVHLPFRVLHDFHTPQKGNLELILNPLHGTALENIVWDHAVGNQPIHQLRQHIRMVIDAFEQDGLVANDAANAPEL